MWSLTMIFGYAPLGSGGMLYCNQTPFPLREGGVWAREYEMISLFPNLSERFGNEATN